MTAPIITKANNPGFEKRIKAITAKTSIFFIVFSSVFFKLYTGILIVGEIFGRG